MIITAILLFIIFSGALFQLINPCKALLISRKWSLFKWNGEPSAVSILIARFTAIFVMLVVLWAVFSIYY
jgi:hypothetical protein